MADVNNLNKFRKAAAKKERARAAKRNRVKHGRTAAERERIKAEAAKAKRVLDGARLEDETGPSTEE